MAPAADEARADADMSASGAEVSAGSSVLPLAETVAFGCGCGG